MTDEVSAPVNAGVLSLAFDESIKPLTADSITTEFQRCLDLAFTQEQVVFNHTAIKSQFCHSCCHILAEHLLYLLHDYDLFSVSVIQIRKDTTIHSCIECIYKDSTFYIDASGIYRDIDDAWSRYGKGSASDAYIERHTGERVVDDGNAHAVRKLSELTPFWEAICKRADVDGGNIGDMEHNSLNQITSELLSSV